MQSAVHNLNPDTSLSPANNQRRQLITLSLASLGVVFGDIGTSPLYSMRECFHGIHAIAPEANNVLGVLSLIFWALILIISVKYLGFILRADNRGEGGILALTALVTPIRAMTQRPTDSKGWSLVMLLGLFGAALLYADGIITPAISVLGAVEGLTVAAPTVFEGHVEIITIVLLIGLFVFQALGSARLGAAFGPVLLVWFLTLAILGIAQIIRRPDVLLAISPTYAISFFATNGWSGYVILGTLFLVVTGGEALYADIGHFGTEPIRRMWFMVVLPGLLLNYFGQGAFLLENPAGAVNPFYRMAPTWALYPLIALATAAAVIASQALITGAFSLTLQAIQLGYCPRLRIRHTSAEQMGQIYLPFVNWALMIACIALVVGFETSSHLAAAYGVAITITMLITTLLFSVFLRTQWKWSIGAALLVAGPFLMIELAFFGANTLKIVDGGWFPLLVGAGVFTLMSTWRRGKQVVAERMRHRLIPVELFLAELLSDPPPRVPGTAIFMSGNPVGTPPALRHNVKHNRVLHETVIILSVETAESPRIPKDERAVVEEIGEGFWRVILTYGFMDEPDIPLALDELRVPQLRQRLDQVEVSYFLGRETLIPSPKPGMALWRERLFTWMSRNAQSATAYFRIPPERVVEIGVQIEL